MFTSTVRAFRLRIWGVGVGVSGLRFGAWYWGMGPELDPCRLHKGSWDLVTGVINKVTILIITYNPN